MQLVVTVEADDIQHGRAKCGSKCPIARATERASGQHVYVHKTAVDIAMWTYHLPKAAVQFIEDFDMGFQVDPFTFTIDDYCLH